MKLFLRNIFILSLPVLGFILFTFWQADGKADEYYLRFTTPKQHSLIVGTSRAAQGIMPGVIDSITGRDGMFNYAMTIGHSPYGKVYFEAIKKKLIASPLDERLDGWEDDVRNGLFILEVNPRSISSITDDEAGFTEADRFLAKLHCVDCKPNIEYLMRFYNKPFIDLWGVSKSQMILHTDGWLEVSVIMDSVNVAQRTEKSISGYRKDVASKYHYSETRYAYLKKTINLLKRHGKVFLVQMPIYDELNHLENFYMVDFDDRMEALCESENISYMDFSAEGSKYRFTDGSHLWKESSREFSIILGKRIQSEGIKDKNK